MTRLLRNALCLTAAATACVAPTGAALAADTIAWIELEGKVVERPGPMAVFGGSDDAALRDIVARIDSLAQDDDIRAIVLRLRDLQANQAQIEEIGGALRDASEAGKPVHVFTEIYGPGELLLGSFADEIIVQQGGAVSFPGISMSEFFLADMLRWIGATPSFVQVGKYKGAEEMLANAAPSEAWEENISGLLDGMWSVMRSRIKEGRGLSDQQLDRALEVAWYADPQDAIEAGLVDAEIDRLALADHLSKEYGDTEYRVIDWNGENQAASAANNPFAIFEMLSAKPKTQATRDTIAVLHIDGAIVDGESTPGGFGGSASVGSLTIRKALKQIEDDDLIKGLVVRIDSPGGSAIASESMWQGMRRVAERKPVWVSVGSMAASGGYYTAVGGEKIYVEPSSIVGSIGVVGGKVSFGETARKMRVNVVERFRGPRAELLSMFEPWDSQQREFVRQRMAETYDLFVSRVEQGRPGVNIGQVAEGRLFTGERAVQLKMADEIGGMTDAIDALATSVGLASGQFDVMDFPAPKSFEEVLEDLAKRFGFAQAGAPAQAGLLSAIGATVREAVGPRAWSQIEASIVAGMQMRDEPVLLVSPRVILFR